jgi:predicted ATPase
LEKGLITNRIDSLSPSAQLVLKVASVIGRNFQYDILSSVFPVEETKPFLRQYISTLVNTGLVSQLHSNDTYTFKHSSVVDCCYNMLLPSQKQQLHQVSLNCGVAHYQRLLLNGTRQI